MEMKEIKKMNDELEKVSAIYELFDESQRLDSKDTNIEFLTTIRSIEKYLKPGMRILDLGAGTGRYSLYFAAKGYDVVAIELVEKHVMAIKQAKTDDMSLEVIQGNAIDKLIKIDDNSFNIILCFGPLYHLEKDTDREKCVNEIKRVCSEKGNMFFAFINNDMVITTETMCYDKNYIKSDNYNHSTFKVNDFPFIFYTIKMARELIHNCGLTIDKEIAADGLSELLADKINSMDDESYRLWLEYHYYTCEQPEFIGFSNHLLFIADKC